MRNTISSFLLNRAAVLMAFVIALVSVVAVTTLAQKSPESQTVAAKTTGSGNITVRVTGDGGRPLPDAMLYFQKSGPGATSDSRVVTNENGEYVFRDLSPGYYIVQASYSGYTPTETTNLTDPERKNGFMPGDSIVFSLTKGGVITGRVTDRSGEPLITMAVRATRVVNVQGRRVTINGYSAETDDRGVYRIFGLPTGSYIVSVSGRPFGARINANPYFDSLPTFYPATNRENAKEVAVTVGGEATGVDITFGPVAGHSISGKIVNTAWTANGSINIRLSQVGANDSGQAVSLSAEDTDHSFQFTGVEDGEYWITANYYQGGASSRGKSQRFKVKGNDVTGINVTLALSAAISGKLIFEPATSTQLEPCQQKSATPFGEITVVARKDIHGDTNSTASYGRGAGDKGDFLIPDMDAGRYVMGARFQNEDVYVASITGNSGRPVGMKSVASNLVGDLSNLITIGSGERNPGIVIKIANGAASIRGRVTAGGDTPITSGGFSLYLLPVDRDLINEATRYYEFAIASEGKFTLKNLAPGKYWIVAMPTPKNGDIASDFGKLIFDNSFRAMIRKQAETKGTQLDLKPCQRVNDLSLKIQ